MNAIKEGYAMREPLNLEHAGPDAIKVAVEVISFAAARFIAIGDLEGLRGLTERLQRPPRPAATDPMQLKLTPQPQRQAAVIDLPIGARPIASELAGGR